MREYQNPVRDFWRRVKAFKLRARGFSGKMAREWVRLVDAELASSIEGVNSKLLSRAHKRGFRGTTVSRFGINEDTEAYFVSERDYYFLHPLNGKYGKWIRDRVSTREIFKPYSEMFETIHFHLVPREGELQVIPISEEAKRNDASVEGVASFLREHGPQRIASAGWLGALDSRIDADTDGERCTGLVIDGRCYDFDEVSAVWKAKADQQSLVLIDAHAPALRTAIEFPRTTIRLIVANWDGLSPRVHEAFLRWDLEADLSAVLSSGKEVKAEDLLAQTEREQTETRLAFNSLNSGFSEGPHAGIPTIPAGERVKLRMECPIELETGNFASGRALLGQRIYSFGVDPATNAVLEGSVLEWSEIKARIEELCAYAPQLEFVEFLVGQTIKGPTIVGVSAFPVYGSIWPFASTTTDGLKQKVRLKQAAVGSLNQRVKKFLRNSKLRLRKDFTWLAYPRGLVPYQSVRWLGDMRRDFFSRTGVDLRQKIWAYRNGFLSYRLPQYGITPETRGKFISDFEYRWLRHINNEYKYWLEDKVSIKYVAAGFNELLPEYYYYTSAKSGENCLVPMMDLPSGYGATFDDVLRLAREKGVLALKPDEGSHGSGFYRLEYTGGGYLLNGNAATRGDVVKVLSDPDSQYLVTEFIIQHPVLQELYPHSVNTIRLIVFKDDGVVPQIGNAYLRIGSALSGFVDNVGAGGMIAEVDLDTGRFHSGAALSGGRMVSVPRHPDSGLLIEGTIPNWALVKHKVLEIAESIPQIEYFGFDVAITADGFKIPEINRFPDYPRISRLTPETIDYLLRKVNVKKGLFGYDRRRPRKPFTLPERDPLFGGLEN